MSRDTRRLPRRPSTPGVAAPSDRRYRRSDGAGGRRRRRGARGWLVRVRGLGVAVLLAAVGVWGAGRLLTSDMFLVREIAVRGNHHLSIGEIETLLTGLRGERVLSVDFDAYRQQLLDSPWVAEVSLARVLPSTIVVDVTERTPVALARLDSRLYLVDSTGNIIDEYRADHREFDLPIVDGLLGVSGPGGGEGTDDGRAALVAALLGELGDRPAIAARISQIDVSDARDVAVMLDDDAAWLHLGRDRFEARLQRYLDLRPVLQDRFGTIDYVDLKFDERVYVRGRDERAARR